MSLLAAADELYALLSDGAVGALPVAEDATRLPSGLAISPVDAARCVADGTRTAMLLRGVSDAILELQARLPGEKLEVVYAGTGPFAPLVVPLLHRFQRGVRYTLIDCHAPSIAHVERVLGSFGYADAEVSLIVADATTYAHPGAIHLIIIETLQQALTVEPQVAIARHLAPQLHPDGIMVPQLIEVALAYVPRPGTAGRDVPIRRMVEVSLPRLREQWPQKQRVTMPDPPDGHVLAYTTRIRAFRAHVIGEGSSGLTMPKHLWGLTDVRAGEEITFWYELGQHPGIRYERRGSHQCDAGSDSLSSE